MTKNIVHKLVLHLTFRNFLVANHRTTLILFQLRF